MEANKFKIFERKFADWTSKLAKNSQFQKVATSFAALATVPLISEGNQDNTSLITPALFLCILPLILGGLAIRSMRRTNKKYRELIDSEYTDIPQLPNPKSYSRLEKNALYKRPTGKTVKLTEEELLNSDGPQNWL